jgi:phosphatidylglycerophosphatase A
MKRYLYFALATFFGSGFAPGAPGTAGSLLAAVLYWLFPFHWLTWCLIITGFFFTGVLAATFVEKERGHDPGLVVIDEAVGQWISYLFIAMTPLIWIAGFILFRLFDIFKPWPINRSQQLKAGWGIMIDDVLAGISANLALRLLIYLGVFK